MFKLFLKSKYIKQIKVFQMSKVVLQNKFADSLALSDHVIVAKSIVNSDNVLWYDVDKTSLTNKTNKVPASKLVYDLSTELSGISNNQQEISSNVENLSINTTDISSNQNTLSIESSNKIDFLSTNLSVLSSNLSNLYNHKAVRFIGVSETDPATGIITLNGIKYVISSDFTSANNGDIIYYRANISNHDNTQHIPDDSTSSNYRAKDQDANVDYVGMIYSYIYSNGVLDDYGQIQVNENNLGTFKQIGYGFYENLSTLIHDYDVCDFANIQKHKISGLVDDLNDLYKRDNIISSGLSDAVSNNINNIEYISANYATLQDLSNSIDDISSTVSNYYATKYELNNVENNLKAKDTELQDNIDSVNSIVTNNYIANDRVIIGYGSNINTLVSADISNNNTHPIDYDFAADLINKKFNLSDIVTTSYDAINNYRDNIYKVPCNKVLIDLLYDLSNKLNNLLSTPIGTLRFNTLSSVPLKSNQQIIDDEYFNGWVYPNGEQITCLAGQFQQFKENQKLGLDDTSFKLPLISNFIEMTPDFNYLSSALLSNNYQISLPIHYHNITVTAKSRELTGKVSIPTGNDVGDGSLAHYGRGTRKTPINTTVNVNFAELNMTGVVNSTTLTNDNNDNIENVVLNGEPKPYHMKIPVMIYIGLK